MAVLSVVKNGAASLPATGNLENVGIPGAGHIYDGIVKEYNGSALPIRGRAKYMFPNGGRAKNKYWWLENQADDRGSEGPTYLHQMLTGRKRRLFVIVSEDEDSKR